VRPTRSGERHDHGPCNRQTTRAGVTRPASTPLDVSVSSAMSARRLDQTWIVVERPSASESQGRSDPRARVLRRRRRPAFRDVGEAPNGRVQDSMVRLAVSPGIRLAKSGRFQALRSWPALCQQRPARGRDLAAAAIASSGLLGAPRACRLPVCDPASVPLSKGHMPRGRHPRRGSRAPTATPHRLAASHTLDQVAVPAVALNR
jgi:hypothetical protein